MPSALDPPARAAMKAAMLAFGPFLDIERPERIALPGPAIFALNHSNSLEAVVVPAALMSLRGGTVVCFLADWMYLHVPVAGWLLRHAEVIPVYGKPARWRFREAQRLERRKDSVLDACLARLTAGDAVGIFPEGTRNRNAESLMRGRAGLGELVLRSSAPVVPVGIHYPAAARLGRPPRLGRTVLRPGPPLDFKEERAAAAGLDPRGRIVLARRIVGRVMADLASLSGKTLPIPRNGGMPCEAPSLPGRS